jgi:alkylhydroperoxidase/carboxymuconolactone decarboxylase family protein YurZ
MFEDISEIRKARKKYNYKMFQSGISTFQEMEQLEAHAFQPGTLARKYKELIALGVSIAQACYG